MDLEKYQTQTDDDHIYTFISIGLKDIVKVIRYDRLGINYHKFDGVKIEAYNLGFGDKKVESFEIDDMARSNNGDMFVVFNTVLHSIPTFFSKIENSALHVIGADKVRHLAYHQFINQRYDKLIFEYEFYGSLDGVIQNYKIGTIYNYIVVILKKP